MHQLLVLLLPLWLGGILDPALGIDLDYKHKQMGSEGSFSVGWMVPIGSCKDGEEKKDMETLVPDEGGGPGVRTTYGPQHKRPQLAQVRLSITEKEGAIIEGEKQGAKGRTNLITNEED